MTILFSQKVTAFFIYLRRNIYNQYILKYQIDIQYVVALERTCLKWNLGLLCPHDVVDRDISLAQNIRDIR